jgi:hypothetical protein
MVNLLEDPTPIILAGIAIEAVLGILLVRSGRGLFLIAMGVVALLTLAGLAIERFVVTDVEQVENVIEAGRVAVETNNPAAALALVAPEAREIRERVRDGFAQVVFTEVKVRALTVKVDRAARPMTAEVGFTALATFDGRHGNVPYRNFVAAVNAKLRRQGDRWLVTEVSDIEPGVSGQPVYKKGVPQL